ncbi:hypothetical protein AAU61_00795 [Desulfocarbo indianensis]|nr:hypothetical protein AAU61_00795 [Desulfocarbo indianensis]
MRLRWKILWALMALLTAAGLGPAGGALAAGPSGLIEDSQGRTIQVEEFLNLLPEYYFTFEDAVQSVPLRDVKSLTWLGGGQVRLENRAGKSFTVFSSMQISVSDEIAFRAKDPVSGQTGQAEIDPLLVKKVAFNWTTP